MSTIASRLRLRNVDPEPACPPELVGHSLADLRTGERAVVLGVCDQADPAVARRLYDLGFTPGAPVVMVRTSPLGDPHVYGVADYEIALRRTQARCIRVGRAQ